MQKMTITTKLTINMIKSMTLGIAVIFSTHLVGCANIATSKQLENSSQSEVNNYEVVSLLNYTTQEELSKFGLTPQRINEINALSLDKHWGSGHSYFNGYHKYRVQDFEILVHPHKSDEMYLFKDGKLVLDVHQDNIVRLFKPDTTFPNPMDTAVYWRPTDPSVSINNNTQVYQDTGLDGVDIEGDVVFRRGEQAYMNYLDFPAYFPEFSITKAHVVTSVNNNTEKVSSLEPLQCEPLVADFACCATLEGQEPYRFKLNTGWENISDNPNMMAYCNTDSIEQTREQLQQALYEAK